MPFLYLSHEDLKVLDYEIAQLPGTAPLADVWRRIAEQRVPQAHKIVREITYTGDEATLREQLGRSMAEGVRQQSPGMVISIRTISNSVPQVSDPMEGSEAAEECLVRSGEFVCTLPRGHAGQHIATGLTGRVYRKWGGQ